MIHLAKPVVDIETYITRVVAERQAGVNAPFFTSIAKEWIERCTDYDNSSGDSGLIPKWPQAVARTKSFNTLYSSPSKGSAQSFYISSLRDRSLTLCPMCGEAGTPNTLDHHLPKEHFPDFSILPQNLVPTCDICQGHKLSRYVSAEGKIFLHPYYDAILATQLVRLRIVPPYNGPAPELLCHPDVDVEHSALILSHLSELQLQPRFLSYFRTDYIRMLHSVSKIRARGGDVDQMIGIFASHAAYTSVNCWEHLLYEGTLADEELMEFLRSGILPDHL